MNTFEKITVLVNNIKNYNATDIDINELQLCATDDELLSFILKTYPSYWFENYVIDIRLFTEYFSELFEKYNIYVDGEHTVYGSKTVYAFGNAQITAYNNTVINAYNKSKVYAFTYSTVELHDLSFCEAHNNSCVNMHGGKCTAEYHEESKGTIYSGNAKLYDKSSVVMLEGEIEANDTSHVQTLCGGYKTIKAMDEVTLELNGSPSVDAYNSVQIRAYDLSQVTCHNNVCVEAYNKSIVTLNDYSNCIGHDTATVYVCNANCVKLVDTAVAYNIQSLSPKYTLQGTSYLCDLTDTNTQVQNSATIKWFQSGKIFSNERNLN